MAIEKSGANQLERSSGRFATATGIIGLMLAAGLAWELAEIWRAAETEAFGFLVVQSLYWLPALFYFWALWAIRRTFRDIASGSPFGSAVARGLRHLGLALLTGGAVSFVLVPVLKLARAEGAAVESLSQIDFDDALMWAYLMLFLLGIAILLLGRLVSRAAIYRARSQALEAELDEFF